MLGCGRVSSGCLNASVGVVPMGQIKSHISIWRRSLSLSVELPMEVRYQPLLKLELIGKWCWRIIFRPPTLF